MNFQLPKIDPSFVWTVPSNLTQQAISSLGGLKFQLPYIDTNFFVRDETGSKPLMEMKNELTVKKFNLKKSLTLGKQASYAR